MTNVSSLKHKALSLGFDLIGIAPAGPAPHAKQLLDWLDRGCAGDMGYMERSAESRGDPRTRFPWAKSILCVAMSYSSRITGSADTSVGHRAAEGGAAPGRISCYAWGDDYHAVMEGPMAALEGHLRRIGAKETKVYVDTGPVLERDWAALAGLGWIGKNTMLINQGMGSWLFLGVILTDLELDADEPAPGRCGTCTGCIEACPTGALLAPYLLDSRLCISYLTIEFKGVMPPRLRELTGAWVFGCDICQAACPWNSKAASPGHSEFEPRPGLPSPDLRWALSNPEGLSSLISGTAVERARGERLTRNLIIAAGNSGDLGLAEVLEPYAITASSRLAEQVGWALKRLRGRRS